MVGRKGKARLAVQREKYPQLGREMSLQILRIPWQVEKMVETVSTLVMVSLSLDKGPMALHISTAEMPTSCDHRV